MTAVDANVVGDLVARERRSDAVALRAPALGRTYDYARLCTDVWRTAHLLRLRGVHGSATVAVAADPVPETVLAFVGAALLGATTRFVELPSGPDRPVSGDARDRAPALDVRALVAPVDRIEAWSLPPGAQRIAYGGPPDDPSVVHFERDVWSENPTEPPDVVDPGTVAFATDDDSYTHRELLDAARGVVKRLELGPSDCVVVRASVCRPGAVVAGVLAPLAAGASMLFPAEDSVGDCAVGTDPASAPENRFVEVDGVL